MALTLDFNVQYSFEVDADYDAVFNLLADIPLASSFHPSLDKIVDLGNGYYRWEMKKIGVDKINMQTLYTCLYESDRQAGTIVWTPVPDEGNASVDGCFRVKRKEGLTQVESIINSTVTLPLPALMKKLVIQFVTTENRKLNEQYIRNLIQQFGGGRMLSL